jgi:2-methylcitrate dehydratase PrpD
MSAARAVTAELSALAAGDFPAADTPAVRHAARRHLLDTIGAIVAGMHEPPARIAAQTFDALGMHGTVIVPNMARRRDVLAAAYLMGTAGHGLELDDGYTLGSVHPGVAVVPALLAAIQLRPVPGARLVRAVAAGYELVARLAHGIHPASRRRGFHNTAVVGPLAAAGAVGALYGHDAAMIEHALGLAASSSGGLFAFLHSGGDVKRLHAGHAAREGLFAALLAEQGMRGPAGVIESRDGFVQAYGDPASSALLKPAVTADARAAVTRCYMKPWACCRHIHPALDGMFDIQRATGLRAGDVARIDVATYAIGAEHGHTGWDDALSAQMSYPYALAVALVRGTADLADFDDSARADRAVTAICPKVTVQADAALDAEYPKARYARIRITTTGGATHERLVDDGYGSPENPITDEALATKFDGLVAPALGIERARAFRAAIDDLDSATDAAPLMRLLEVSRA